RGARRFAEIQGLPVRTERRLRLPALTQWAAVRTLSGAISEPLQMKWRLSSSATANCQPAAFALPPPTIRGSGDWPAAAEPASKAGASPGTAVEARRRTAER